MSLTQTVVRLMLEIMWTNLRRTPDCGFSSIAESALRRSASPHMNTKHPGMRGAPSAAHRRWNAPGVSPVVARNRVANDPRLE